MQEIPSSTMRVAQPWQLYTCLIIFCGVQGHQPRCTIRLLPPCSRSSATLISLKAGLDLGGSSKIFVFFYCSRHMTVPHRFPEENQDRHHCNKKNRKCCFPLFWHCFERIWLSLMGVTFVDNNPWGFQLALCLFPRFLNAIYF